MLIKKLATVSCTAMAVALLTDSQGGFVLAEREQSWDVLRKLDAEGEFVLHDDPTITRNLLRGEKEKAKKDKPKKGKNDDDDNGKDSKKDLDKLKKNCRKKRGGGKKKKSKDKDKGNKDDEAAEKSDNDHDDAPGTSQEEPKDDEEPTESEKDSDGKGKTRCTKGGSKCVKCKDNKCGGDAPSEDQEEAPKEDQEEVPKDEEPTEETPKEDEEAPKDDHDGNESEDSGGKVTTKCKKKKSKCAKCNNNCDGATEENEDANGEDEETGPIHTGNCGGKKVWICHCPPGNPNNCHSVRVCETAWKADKNHGLDTHGKCKSSDSSGQAATDAPSPFPPSAWPPGTWPTPDGNAGSDTDAPTTSSGSGTNAPTTSGSEQTAAPTDSGNGIGGNPTDAPTKADEATMAPSAAPTESGNDNNGEDSTTNAPTKADEATMAPSAAPTESGNDVNGEDSTTSAPTKADEATMAPSAAPTESGNANGGGSGPAQDDETKAPTTISNDDDEGFPTPTFTPTVGTDTNAPTETAAPTTSGNGVGSDSTTAPSSDYGSVAPSASGNGAGNNEEEGSSTAPTTSSAKDDDDVVVSGGGNGNGGNGNGGNDQDGENGDGPCVQDVNFAFQFVNSRSRKADMMHWFQDVAVHVVENSDVSEGNIHVSFQRSVRDIEVDEEDHIFINETEAREKNVVKSSLEDMELMAEAGFNYQAMFKYLDTDFEQLSRFKDQQGRDTTIVLFMGKTGSERGLKSHGNKFYELYPYAKIFCVSVDDNMSSEICDETFMLNTTAEVSDVGLSIAERLCDKKELEQVPYEYL